MTSQTRINDDELHKDVLKILEDKYVYGSGPAWNKMASAAIDTVLYHRRGTPWLGIDEEGMEIVVMDQSTIDEIPDYSISIPTGVYFGKRWKAHRRAPLDSGKEWLDGWYLSGYYFSPAGPDVGHMSIQRLMTPEEYNVYNVR